MTLIPLSGRIVADIGNSRMKWAALGPDGRIVERVALPLDAPTTWIETLQRWGVGTESRWAIASVNPPVASVVEETLRREGMIAISWFRSAADVPQQSTLKSPNRAGVDRALAVLAATAIGPKAGPGLVISCGTAITVERISDSHIWQGGVIAPGLGVSARALTRNTAQLPLVLPTTPPCPWGQDTDSALAAGIFWGMVGAVREIIRRQDDPGSPPRWRIWTGGDAEILASQIEDERSASLIVPDLVLIGLGIAAFGVSPETIVS